MNAQALLNTGLIGRYEIEREIGQADDPNTHVEVILNWAQALRERLKR